MPKRKRNTNRPLIPPPPSASSQYGKPTAAPVFRRRSNHDVSSPCGGKKVASPTLRKGNGNNNNQEETLETTEDAVHCKTGGAIIPPPYRDCTDLYASCETVWCALYNHQNQNACMGCIPCAYKIGCFDVALDIGFCQRIPNQRAETCPRLRQQQQQTVQMRSSIQSNNNAEDDYPLGYTPGMHILTLGDGDLTFSLAIARIVSRSRKKQPCDNSFSGGRLIATSYESKTTLEEIYPMIHETIHELEELGAEIHFQVDATKDFRQTLLQQQTHPIRFFDRIVWNFPCTAVARGQDGQNQEMERNKDLVRTFVSHARHILRPNGFGQIHMNHKTKPPFNQWNIEKVAIEDSLDDDGGPIVQYRGRVVVDRCLLPPYTPRKALDRKSFPMHDACTYIFDLVPTIGRDQQSPPGETVNEQQQNDEQSVCGDAFLPMLQSASQKVPDQKESIPRMASLHIPVTTELIQRVRSTLLRSLPNQRKRTKTK